MPNAFHNDDILFRLLKLSPFERRPRGGWRFGTKRISNAIVDRLVASRHAKIIGDRVIAIATPTPSVASPDFALRASPGKRSRTRRRVRAG